MRCVKRQSREALKEVWKGNTPTAFVNPFTYLLMEKLRSNQFVLLWLLHQLRMAKPLLSSLCFGLEATMCAPFPSLSQQALQKYVLITLHV